nr:hypothetical protein [Candidatus Omnitrophota bacterium]
VFAHELGHNLNMAHAGTDPENDGVMNAEYGDSSDVMGSSRAKLTLNAGHVDQQGWFAPYSGSTVNVAADGNFTLYPLDLDPRTTPGPRILKIQKPSGGGYYYVSYRRNITAYNGLSTTYTQGANIHRYAGSGYGYTYFIKSLTDGAQFIDTPNAIKVTQLGKAVDLSTIDVNVDFGEIPCTPATPTLSISPYDQPVKPGAAASFNVALTNRDSSTCSATAFNLAVALPAGVTGTISPAYLSLGPSQSGSASMTVYGSVEGRNQLNVSSQDNDGVAPTHNVANASAFVTVDATAPQAPTNLTAAQVRKKWQLTWSAASDGTGSGIASYDVYKDTGAGFALVGSSTSTTYAPSVQTGTNIFAVKAVDRAGNASGLSNTVTITVSTPGGGKRK